MRHVDHAHHAERDRQADRNQHEHRPEAQPEEQRLRGAIYRQRAIDARDCRRRSRAYGCISLDEAAIRVFLEKSREPVADLLTRTASQRLDGRDPLSGVRSVERQEREAQFDLAFHAAIGLSPGAFLEQRRGGIVERPQHFGDRVQPDRGVGVGEIEPRHCHPQGLAKAVVRADLGQFFPRGRTGGLQGQGIDQFQRRRRLVRRPGNDDTHVRRTDIQPVAEQRCQHIPRARVTALDELTRDSFFVGKAGVAQLSQPGEKRLVSRLRERRGGNQDGGEQQPEPLPARRSACHL